MTNPRVWKSQIAHEIRTKISEGHYQPGDMLPSIPDLIQHYQVSRETVRAAIALLATEGLALPERGRGTIVRDTHPVTMTYTPGAASRTWKEQTQGSDQVVYAAWEEADPGVAETLGIAEGGPVVRRTRHFTRGRGVVQTVDQWIPQHVAGAVAVDLANREVDDQVNLFELMAAAGHAPATTTETVGARMPTPDEREDLSLPPGTPVHVTHRVTRGEDESPLETSLFVGAGDRVSSTFTVPLNY